MSNTPCPNSEARPPNIIFLMTDQQRFDALGCVDPVVQTPNLDRLAARGIRFDQAVCNNPMCVPSRYSMMLGLYSSQCGVRHNTQYIARDADLPRPVIAQELLEAGYQTAGFGKTHYYLGKHIGAGMPTEPSTRGFEYVAKAMPVDPGRNPPGAKLMSVEEPEAFAALRAETAPYGPGGEQPRGYIGDTSALPPERHREGWLTRKALAYLDEQRDPTRPLLLYLSLDFPHAGMNPPAAFEALYDLEAIPDRPAPPWESGLEPDLPARDNPWRATWAGMTPRDRRRTTLRYYAACSFVDHCFGQVLDRLEALGELEDALILFTADHGEMLGDHGHRFSKYCLLDGAVRTPLILAGSRVPREARGTVEARPAELVDLVPTLRAAAGLPPEPSLPGENLLGPSRRRGQFAEMHGMGYEELQQAPAYMWRAEGWKLVLWLPGALEGAEARLDQIRGNLYHLETDPQEWRDRYDDPACREIRERMTRALLMHLAVTWARYPWQPSRARPVAQ